MKQMWGQRIDERGLGLGAKREARLVVRTDREERETMVRPGLPRVFRLQVAGARIAVGQKACLARNVVSAPS